MCRFTLIWSNQGETSSCKYKLLSAICTVYYTTVAVESDVVFIKFEDGKFILQQLPLDITAKLFRTRELVTVASCTFSARKRSTFSCSSSA